MSEERVNCPIGWYVNGDGIIVFYQFYNDSALLESLMTVLEATVVCRQNLIFVRRIDLQVQQKYSVPLFIDEDGSAWIEPGSQLALDDIASRLKSSEVFSLRP
jgi:hypothetical protein